MEGGLYRLDPAVSEYVASVGRRIAAQSPVDLPYEFVVLDNSVPNAWALPGGKIAVNRGLLVELASEAELAAVLGHEMVHAAARHGAQSIERGTLLQGALLAAVIGLGDQSYGGAVIGGAQVAAGLLSQKYGRDAERESDAYGTRYMARAGYDPEAAVRLQETFVRLSEEGGKREGAWLDGLFASHPPSRERVESNRRTVRELRAEGIAGGEVGQERHQAAIASLVRDAQAYRDADAARAKMVDDPDAALALVGRALDAQPKEASFHGLRGRIRLSQKRWDDALTNYDRALARDDAMFDLYLGRGLARARLGDDAGARADLTRSIELLPTPTAQRELGKLAERRGDTPAAIDHYALAAEGGGAGGRAAFVDLVRLDLPRRPERYVATALERDGRGRVVLVVANRAGLDLAALEFEVQVGFASGVATFRPRLGRLAAGETSVLVVSDSTEPASGGEARVLSATVAGT
jgi:predicted Zn-dependent protease